MLFKLSIFFIVTVNLSNPQVDWWYDMEDRDTPPSLQYNPYYQAHQYMQNQMNLFGYAQHVGKIYRGQYFNPELNRPRDRAYGYQSDFNNEEFNSGAFRNPSEGQRIRASQAHVDRGLAQSVGEITVIPVGTNVQPDGTILVQTSSRKNPCIPNPCSKYKMSQCDVVNHVTAKCSQHGDYELVLRWTTMDHNHDDNHDHNDPDEHHDHDDDDHDPHFHDYDGDELFFGVGPSYHDGTECTDSYCHTLPKCFIIYGNAGCGVIGRPRTDPAAPSDGVMVSERTFLLTQLDDGTKYQDFTYQVVVEYGYGNPSRSNAELVISYEGEVKQVVKIPQYHGQDHVNNSPQAYYLFGCFRPYVGGYYLDTNGAGYYNDADVIMGGLRVGDIGLCNALRGWTGPAGYNHNNDQSGSDEYNHHNL